MSVVVKAEDIWKLQANQIQKQLFRALDKWKYLIERDIDPQGALDDLCTNAITPKLENTMITYYKRHVGDRITGELRCIIREICDGQGES